jgi:hypothetical protein
MKKISSVLLGTFLLILLLGFLNLRVFLIKLREGDETPNIVVLVQPDQSQPDAAETITNAWLEYFKTRQYVSAIDDFRITRLDTFTGTADSFDFTAAFAVKPKGKPERSNWKQNTGGRIEGEWVENITARIIVKVHNGRYNFEVLFYYY